MKIPNKTIKKFFSIGIISILLLSSLVPFSVAYADIVLDQNSGGESVDMFEQQSEQDRLNMIFGNQEEIDPNFSIFSQDPEQLQNTGGGLNANAAVGSCVKGLIGSIVGNMFSNAMGSFVGKLGGSIGFGGGEVPVGDSQIRSNTESIELKETKMDGIAHCLGNMIIEGMLQSTISWVKGGFQGNPAFIDDPSRFFMDMADYELGQALNQLSGGVLCSPWDIEIRLGLLSKYRGGTRRRVCTLSEIVRNAERFVDGHFSEGGIDAWFELTQNPSNDPYASYLNAIDSYEKTVYNRRATSIIELNWSDGFRNEKDSKGKTTTPGKLIQEQVSKTLDVPAERLTFADEFDELVTEIFNSLVSRLFEGL